VYGVDIVLVGLVDIDICLVVTRLSEANSFLPSISVLGLEWQT